MKTTKSTSGAKLEREAALGKNAPDAHTQKAKATSKRKNEAGRTWSDSHFERLVPNEWRSYAYIENLVLECRDNGLNAAALYEALQGPNGAYIQRKRDALINELENASIDPQEFVRKWRDTECFHMPRTMLWLKHLNTASSELDQQIEKHRNRRKKINRQEKTLPLPIIRYLAVLLLAGCADAGIEFPQALMQLIVKSLDADILRHGPARPDGALFGIARAMVEHPEWSHEQIADAVGCTRQYVSDQLKRADEKSKQRGLCLSDLIKDLESDKKYRESVVGRFLFNKVPSWVTAKSKQIREAKPSTNARKSNVPTK